MIDERLKPWMLRADWRQDERPIVILDLASWPAEVSLRPRPPVPVIAFGVSSHPIAAEADLLVDDLASARRLAQSIARTPLAAAAVADLLRATEGSPPDQALTAESFAMGTLQAGREHADWLASRPAPRRFPPGRVMAERSGDSLTVTIDRPEARNAIDSGLRDALFDAFSLASHDPEIVSVRLRATGRAFGVGADLSEFGATRDPAAAHAIRARTLPARALLPHASICDVHIRGACIGASLELAAFAARVTASKEAWFQLPELSMGLLPGAGGCVSIPARIGRQRAALLMLSGKRISAQTALAWGLIDAIMDDAPLDDRGADEVG